MTPALPGKTILKCGIFPQIPQPEAEGFAGERMKWEKPYEETQLYKASAFRSEKLEG